MPEAQLVITQMPIAAAAAATRMTALNVCGLPN
jgi:hypothetical protein